MELISWKDFEKVEMRVGTVLEVKNFDGARKPAYQLSIDFGPLGIRRSSAQIKTHYQPEEIIGKQVIAVVNFPEKQIANFFSQCLVLGIYDDAIEVVLLQAGKAVPNGSRIG